MREGSGLRLPSLTCPRIGQSLRRVGPSVAAVGTAAQVTIAGRDVDVMAVVRIDDEHAPLVSSTKIAPLRRAVGLDYPLILRRGAGHERSLLRNTETIELGGLHIPAGEGPV